MARQNINIGTAANDGTGDPLRTAFDKINDNFIELYGGDNNLNTLDANLDVNNFAITTGATNGDVTITPNGTGSIKLGAMKFVGTTMSSDDSTQITLAENIQTTGTLTVAGATTLSTSLALSSGATVTSILDEDAMGSDSATALATQQSIKAYVDSQVTASDLDFQGDSGGALSVDLDSQTFTVTGGTGIDTSGSGQTLTVAVDSTVATLTGSQTLTNKVLTAPTISSPTITGVTTTTSLTTNDITSNGSNANITINPQGTGTIELGANTNITGTASVSNTLTTADITQTGNTTTVGNNTIQGVLTATSVTTNDITTNGSNADLTLDPQGTGAIVLTGPITATGTQTTTGQLNVDNLRLDGNTLSATSGGMTIDAATGQNITFNKKIISSAADITLVQATTVRADTIQNDTSDGDISISTQGTGNINVNSLKINNLADPTGAQDAATKAYVDAQVLASGDTGDLTIDGSTITAPSNADLTLTTAGTGLVAVNNLKVDGNIQINDNKIATTVSNSNLQLGANGSGKIELMSNTISRTGDIIFDASSDIILDAGGKDIIFQYDGIQFGLFTYAGGNLLIQSGSTTMLTGDGANAIFNGNITVPGSSTLDGVTITDNTIKSNASNADLQIGTNGTGVIDILTATQTTVGSAGGANALPGTPTGYIKVKIGGTMRVIPFYDES